ncbi:MAG: hypothetical protein JNM61_01365 [Zoogloeaceae bacterium]|nr:hypothetical protein [Zoogloeaceae bacterium]
MRIVLLLIVVAAIGIAAKHFLSTSVPVVAPQAGGPASVPASRESLRQFSQDVNDLTREGAAARARQAEEATR